MRFSLVVFAALSFSAPVALAQRYEVFPFLGFRSGGTMEFRAVPGNAQSSAKLNDGVSGGVSAGILFREDSQVAFRWARRAPDLLFTPTASTIPSASLNDFQGEFSTEYEVRDYAWMKPFLAVTAGMTKISVPDQSFNRFSFGVGGGLKIFPKPRYGLRIQMMYAPVVMNPEFRTPAYTIQGPLLHQFEFSFGPVFRF